MDEEDLKKALAALAVIGIGYAAFKTLDDSAQRRRFKEALSGTLAQQGIGLVEATIGRAQGRRFWRVTYNHPWVGIMRSDVRIPDGWSVAGADMLQLGLDEIDQDVQRV